MAIFLFPYLLPCVICVPLIFTFLFLHYHQRSSISNEGLPLPPGRFGWPLLGESLEFFSKLKNGVPANFVTERFTKYSSKVFRTSLLGEPMVMLSGAEGNKFLFSNEGKEVQVWFPSAIEKIFPKTKDEPMHEWTAKLRKILLPFLKADALHKYVDTMDAVMKQHLEVNWNGKEVVKVSNVVPSYTIAMACRLLLSIEDREKVEKLGKRIGDVVEGTISLPINIPGTAFYRAIKASRVVRKEFAEVITQRKTDLSERRVLPTQDVLSQMLVTSDENGQFLSEFTIANTMVGLLHGGTHTINSALTSIMMYLAELPHVYNEVLREQLEIARSKDAKVLLNWEDISKMRYSWNVANEVLRLRPPSFGTFREAITDFTYSEYKIPKGWKLHWLSYSTHKNPKYFPDPEKFEPSRFEGNGPPPYTFVPFGGGPRMCPGNEYARLVILVFIHNVVTNFRWEKIIPREKIVTDPLPRPTQGLPVRLYRHDP